MSVMADKLALASRLRQRITIQRPVDVSDSVGGYNRSWVMHARVWAEVLPQTASERVLDSQLTAVSRTRFTIRYRDDLTSDMRISYDGESYTIRSITDLYARGVALEIVGESGVAS